MSRFPWSILFILRELRHIIRTGDGGDGGDGDGGDGDGNRGDGVGEVRGGDGGDGGEALTTMEMEDLPMEALLPTGFLTTDQLLKDLPVEAFPTDLPTDLPMFLLTILTMEALTMETLTMETLTTETLLLKYRFPNLLYHKHLLTRAR